MKTRQAFVANSSSSSFIVVYKESVDIYNEQKTKAMLDEGKNIICFNGRCLSDGMDRVVLTKEIYDLIIKHEIFRLEFVELMDTIYDEATIKPEHVGYKIAGIEQDYHCTNDDLEIFIARYVEREY